MTKERKKQRALNIDLPLYRKVMIAYHRAAAKNAELSKAEFYKQLLERGLGK